MALGRPEFGPGRRNPAIHGQWGYTSLSAVFLPMLAERGVTTAQIRTLTHTAAARVLTIE